eukprot:NODE_224_length_13912_cov_0.116604.p1 type:complete len:472 gc:universal NODE_224_length_13912_cov_0.116604:1557-142(-)
MEITKLSVNLKYFSVVMFISCAIFMLHASYISKNTNLSPISKMPRFKPTFKNHGVPNFYGFKKELFNKDEPAIDQLNRKHVFSGSIDMHKFDELLNTFEYRYFKNSKEDKGSFRFESLDTINPVGFGSGVIICGKDEFYLELYALVSYIRDYSSISIELYHVDSISIDNLEALEQLGNLKAINLKNDLLLKYQISKHNRIDVKSLVMMRTGFENVIYLDSKVFPLLHLDKLIFDKTIMYLDTVDILLFRDEWMMSSKNTIFNFLNLGYAKQRTINSDIIVYKKSKLLPTLKLAYYIHSDPVFDVLFHDGHCVLWFAHSFLSERYDSSVKAYLNHEFLGHLNNGMGILYTMNSFPAFVHLKVEKWNGESSSLKFENLKGRIIKSLQGTLEDDYSQVLHYRVLDSETISYDIHGNKIYNAFYRSLMKYQSDNNPFKVVYQIFNWTLLGFLPFVLYFVFIIGMDKMANEFRKNK